MTDEQKQRVLDSLEAAQTRAQIVTIKLKTLELHLKIIAMDMPSALIERDCFKSVDEARESIRDAQQQQQLVHELRAIVQSILTEDLTEE